MSYKCEPLLSADPSPDLGRSDVHGMLLLLLLLPRQNVDMDRLRMFCPAHGVDMCKLGIALCHTWTR